MRTHKRKHHHHHHHSSKERKKHKEHKSREEKSSHKQKRKKNHKELPLPADPTNQEDVTDLEFKMPNTRSAVTVVKRPTDPKVSLLAPDLESPVLPPCVQNFSEPLVGLSVTCSEQDTVSKGNTSDDAKGTDSKGSKETNITTATLLPVKTATTSSESIEEDGIEEGEILEGGGTHTPTGNSNLPLRDGKVARKLKRNPSQSTTEKQPSHKLKKRKWKKEKDFSGEKTKKHKIR